MVEINASNHWSRRPWIAVVERENTILIYTDTEFFLFGIVQPNELTEDDRQLANHIITLHNKTLKEGQCKS